MTDANKPLTPAESGFICPDCYKSIKCRCGKTKAGSQRFQCQNPECAEKRRKIRLGKKTFVISSADKEFYEKAFEKFKTLYKENPKEKLLVYATLCEVVESTISDWIFCIENNIE